LFFYCSLVAPDLRGDFLTCSFIGLNSFLSWELDLTLGELLLTLMLPNKVSR
jgi:hypothetical protein